MRSAGINFENKFNNNVKQNAINITFFANKTQNMKNLKKISLLVILMAFAISCTTMKNDANTPVSGKVESIEGGKDGYTAKITTDTKEVYFAIISIVNVGGPQNYKQLKIGDVVSVKGEKWKTEDENHIKVTEIVSVK